jgi:hypothetical protein
MLPTIADLLCVLVGIALGIGGAMMYVHTHQAKALAAVATEVADVAAVKAKV